MPGAFLFVRSFVRSFPGSALNVIRHSRNPIVFTPPNGWAREQNPETAWIDKLNFQGTSTDPSASPHVFAPSYHLCAGCGLLRIFVFFRSLFSQSVDTYLGYPKSLIDWSSFSSYLSDFPNTNTHPSLCRKLPCSLALSVQGRCEACLEV